MADRPIFTSSAWFALLNGAGGLLIGAGVGVAAGLCLFVGLWLLFVAFGLYR